MIEPVNMGGRLVGPGQPCYVVAEAGINHDGDMAIAHELIDMCADAGADAVKFQNYRTEDFVSDHTLTYEYRVGDERVTETQFDMFKRRELPPGAIRELREHCDRRDIGFMSTPTGEEGIAELVEAKAAAVKNGSDYLVNLRLIEAMARSGLPTVLSTGMSTVAEVDDAVRAFRDAGGTELVLLHCTSSYPTPPEDVHLRRLAVLQDAFGCPVGFSDHTEGVAAAIGAVALGACFVEKHVTLDKRSHGPDHWFSADPGELTALVAGIRVVERSLGEPIIGPTAAEEASRRDFRLSCVAVRDLPAGHVLAEADIAFRRPGTGAPPRDLPWLVGHALSRDVSAGVPLGPEDLE